MNKDVHQSPQQLMNLLSNGGASANKKTSMPLQNSHKGITDFAQDGPVKGQVTSSLLEINLNKGENLNDKASKTSGLPSINNMRNSNQTEKLVQDVARLQHLKIEGTAASGQQDQQKNQPIRVTSADRKISGATKINNLTAVSNGNQSNEKTTPAFKSTRGTPGISPGGMTQTQQNLQSTLKSQPNSIIGKSNIKLLKPESSLVRRLVQDENDERYRYLLKHSHVHYIEAETLSLYVELKQIPNILIVYRRPKEREQNIEKMTLDSRGLKHIPLLEGEEKVKYLNLQNNEITKIENLVSLPQLNFIDLSANRLTEINPFPTVMHLRVLILSRNQIDSIKNVDCFANLDVLDLHDNRISKIEHLAKLQSLRVLNLSNNQIEQLQLPQDGLKSLIELNLRKNKIKVIQEIRNMPKLQKLYLTNNQIDGLGQLNSLQNLKNLTDLTIENNPIEKQKGFISSIKEKIPSLNYLNLQKVSSMFDNDQLKSPQATKYFSKDQSGSNTNASFKTQSVKPSPMVGAAYKASETKDQVAFSNVSKENGFHQVIDPSIINNAVKPFKAKNDCNVIKIIQKEWDKEVERLNAKRSGANKVNGKSYSDKSYVQSGHAEIEANKILYIYGNALEVLQRAEFYEQVEEMYLQYVRFDLIVYHLNLEKLKKFTKLKKLILANNYLNSYILLSKIECLNTVQSLEIHNNELLQIVALKSFIVYRFQHVQEFNGKMITDGDRKIAKQQFQLFDKILSIQNVFTKKPTPHADPVKRQEHRQKSKKNQEIAHIYTKNLIDDITKKDQIKENILSNLEDEVQKIIMKTTWELTGDKNLEKSLKKSLTGHNYKDH